MITISKHAPQYFFSRPLIIFNYQKSILLLLFLLKHAKPDSVDRAVGLGQARAVIPAGQLCDVGVELLYTLYKLASANPLGLFEHVGKVVLFLLSCVVGNHSEKVEHNAFVK